MLLCTPDPKIVKSELFLTTILTQNERPIFFEILGSLVEALLKVQIQAIGFEDLDSGKPRVRGFELWEA